MEGFFTKEQTKSTSRPDGKVRSCVSCGRSLDCETPNFPFTGEGKKGIFVLLPYPSEKEDSLGRPYGEQYNHLRTIFKKQGVSLLEDCWVGYSISCAGPLSTPYQVECCRKNVLSFLDKNKPKVILCVGDDGLRSLIGHRWKKGLDDIGRWNGHTIPDQDLKTWIVPTFPLYTLTGKGADVYYRILEENVTKVLTCAGTPFPLFQEPEIIYLEDLSALNKIKTGYSSFDYETTGIKPHAAGHRIICASVAVNENKVYSFLMPTSPKERKPFTDYLKNKHVLKMAHNMKYEDTWSRVRLRTEVQGWLWDSMLAAHVIDNRPGTKGLKFQTYVRLGIVDYDSEIAPYLRSTDEKDSNALNTIEECLKSSDLTQKLLKYCAMDSIVQYRLAMYQRKHMAARQGKSEVSPVSSDFMSAYNLLHEGCLALTKAEHIGLRIDVEYIEKTQRQLTRKIERLEKKIKESDFFKKWQKHSKTSVNIDSNDALAKYLYGVLGVEPKKRTDKGTPSTDEQALSMLHIPECDWLIERSKLKKLRDTFLQNFYREQVNGVMHPQFNLHSVKTYRSSSSSPNFQNIPKRDKFAFKTVRNSIYPRKGHQLMEMDFSGMEVSIAACYHKDPNMISYLLDDTKDMHGDMAAQIFCISAFDKKKESHSTLRKASKNAFVFPQFYGDYYKNNAVGLCEWTKLPQSKWKATDGILLDDGLHIGEHMIKKGIPSFDAFVDHMQKIEDHFWNVRFKKYGQWKERQWKYYLKNGYVPFKTGFIAGGVMNRKEVINYVVQGAAFHVLLWSFHILTKRMADAGMKSRLVGQIHDAMVFDVVPDELQTVYDMTVQVATVEAREHFKWINVPLRIDAEVCQVDGSWTTEQHVDFH